MMFPAAVVFLIFTYIPLFGWAMAFTDYRLGQGIFSGSFTGLKQFRLFFQNTNDFGYLIRDTLAINLTSIVLSPVLGLVFTVLLNELANKRYMKIVQSFSFFPYFVSWILVYAIMNGLFATRMGSINLFLMDMGLIQRGIPLLADARYSWGLMIALNMWKGLGYISIIFFATIKGISAELYEAAALDGASRFHRIRYITVPLCIPTASVLLILSSGSVFSNNLEQFFVFWNSTNWTTMEVLDIYIYNFGMRNMNFSYATAVGILKFAISLLLLLLVNRVFKQVNDTNIIG